MKTAKPGTLSSNALSALGRKRKRSNNAQSTGSFRGRIAAPYVSLPDHRLLVVDEEYWTAFYKRRKKVEFRVDTPLEEGMSVLFAMGAAQRRSGLTGLLLAEVSEVCTMSIAKACRRFPMEAKACNLSERWDSPTVASIVVRNVRLAPEFAMLGPGNLGALRQFSHKHCRPQFCHVTDLGKTVTVEHNGKAVQRTMSTAPFIQSSGGRNGGGGGRQGNQESNQ